MSIQRKYPKSGNKDIKKYIRAGVQWVLSASTGYVNKQDRTRVTLGWA